jgi:hypothetical protein
MFLFNEETYHCPLRVLSPQLSNSPLFPLKSKNQYLLCIFLVLIKRQGNIRSVLVFTLLTTIFVSFVGLNKGTAHERLMV